nr:rRNA maturation RNase YbeY [Rhodoligotrophos defluvii]
MDGLSAPSEAPRLSIDILIEDQAWNDNDVDDLEGLTCSAVEAACSVAGLVGQETEVCVLFTDDDEIRRLNAEFRGKDKPTNVLSFPAGDGPQPEGAPLMLGDIVLARGVVVAEAAAQGKPLASHVAHLIVHGMLHLAGFDHEQHEEAELMEALEAKALARLGVPDPYGQTSAAAAQEH